MKKVYISAASQEMARAQAMMGQIAITPTLTNSHDWTKSFDVPAGQPRLSEAELDPRIRRQFSEADIRGVMRADFFWLLAPGENPRVLGEALEGVAGVSRLFQTKGAWFELGSAEMHRRFRGSPIIIVSGAERLQSIFTEVADFFFETDRLALDWLKSQ